MPNPASSLIINARCVTLVSRHSLTSRLKSTMRRVWQPMTRSPDHLTPGLAIDRPVRQLLAELVAKGS